MKNSYPFLILVLGLAAFLPLSAQAFTIVLTSDDFEGSLGNWTAGAGASLYTYSGVGTNFATDGTGAAEISTTSGATGTKTLTLASPLLLVTDKIEEVTVSFDFQWSGTTQNTRWVNLEYSTNGGATWNTNTTNNGLRYIMSANSPASFTFVDGGLFNFTDDVLFRFQGKDDSGGARNMYIDNLVISGVIPEPSRALLGAMGLSILLFRRRR